MVVNIVIGAAIFVYAGWAFIRHIKKSKAGKCAACNSVKSSGAQSCCSKKNIK